MCLLCILVLLCASGLAAAEEADFALRFRVYPEHFPDALQPLADGLSALCGVSTVRGHYAAQEDAFVLSADVDVNGCVIPMDVQGVPSHWRVTSPALGNTALLVNNLALLEFGLKAEDYLGIPLQKAFLLVPYAHTSAWGILADAAAPLLPAGDGESVLSAGACLDLLNGLIALAENDRTVRCYLEALGVQTADLSLLAEDFSRGVTVVRQGDSLRWLAGDVLLMAYACADNGLSLEVSLTGLTIALEWEITSEAFRFTLEAHGALLEDTLSFHAEGIAAPDCLEITVRNAEQAPLVTLHADLAASESRPFPAFTDASLDGVNVLSVNGESLAALMEAIAPTLLPRCIALVAACPAPAVRALMDALDDSGVMPMLTDALRYGYPEY